MTIKDYNRIAYEGVYEVYTHRGEIVIRHGDLLNNGVFCPYGMTTWHTGFKHGFPKPLTLYGRKVWCKTEDDIPKAVEILMNRIKEYEAESEARAHKIEAQMVRVVRK